MEGGGGLRKKASKAIVNSQRQKDRQTDRQTDRKTDRQTDGLTDRLEKNQP